ncbi:hypothetical protein KIN20_001278 [Parelaphostrongylus tenuis]|uniref:Uncharacterized protein n=1 Tax=Parelaphostrongylus tenuis TaxID=148309 RepID=A0AAD5LXV8_PARTN|nr:hypothetical protein KIN20_001278 [Parelaphostrongylus tenuis]
MAVRCIKSLAPSQTTWHEFATLEEWKEAGMLTDEMLRDFVDYECKKTNRMQEMLDLHNRCDKES